MNEHTANQPDYKSLYPDTIAPDAINAAAFLIFMADGGPVTAVAVPVNPDSRPRVYVHHPGNDEMRLAAFLREQETLPHNVFFAPNVSAGRGVPSNADIVRERAVILDFDPDRDKPLEDERMRLREVAYGLINGPVPPTCLNDTGGGMQAVWVLDEPIDITDDNRDIVTEDIEALMRDLSRSLGAETHTCTIKNLFRVPWTKNWPTAAKRKAGRPITFAGMWYAGGPRVSLAALRSLCLLNAEAKADAPEIDLGGVGEAEILDVLGDRRKLPDRAGEVLGLRPVANALMRQVDPSDTSAYDFNLVKTMTALFIAPGDQALVLSACGAKVHKVYAEGRLFSYVVHTVAKAVHERQAATALLGEAGFDEAAAALAREQAKARAEVRRDSQGLINVVDWAAEPDELDDMLVQGLLGRQQMTVIYGESGAGKTFVALDLAYRISLGMQWCGRTVLKCGVVYIAAESPRSIKRRIRALIDTYGPPENFFAMRAAPNFHANDEDVKALAQNIRRLGIDVGLIVIDTLARVMSGGNENQAQDMGIIIQRGDGLRDLFRCNVLWIHHAGKNKNNGARGSSALRAATDTEIEIKDGWFTITKLRDDDAFSRRFKLRKGLVVGKNPDGSPLTSCIVEWPDGPDIVDQEKPHLEDGEMREKVAYLLRKNYRTPMTVGEIVKAAKEEKLSLGDDDPKKVQRAVQMMLTRACDSETDHVFKRMGTKPGIAGQESITYGLYEW